MYLCFLGFLKIISFFDHFDFCISFYWILKCQMFVWTVGKTRWQIMAKEGLNFTTLSVRVRATWNLSWGPRNSNPPTPGPIGPSFPFDHQLREESQHSTLSNNKQQQPKNKSWIAPPLLLPLTSSLWGS